jgi:hypothetical protein
VESVEVDTLVDPRWLPVLADLETGRAVQVVRTGPKALTLDAVVVGWRYTLDPGRWAATVFTSTTTTTKPDPSYTKTTGKTAANLSGAAPNDFVIVQQYADSWSALTWPVPNSFADVAVDGVTLGRYKVSTSFAGSGWLFHTATEMRIACIAQGGTDNRAYLTTKVNKVVTVEWFNVTPPAAGTKD